MDKMQRQPKKSDTLLRFLVSFVIPIVILTRFSGEAQLGPIKGLLLALAFPVGFEAYNMLTRRKLSYASLLVIIGILVTGGISLLGLSENWLAVRRAVPYFAVGIAMVVSILIKHPLLGAILPYILEMEKIKTQAKKRKKEPAVERSIARAGYLISALLIALALASLVLTKAIIDSATNTTGFNNEYARLRLISLPAVTLPLLTGISLILYYLVTSIEKLTSLHFEEILRKK